MTCSQLHEAVAKATGDSLSTIRSMGFQPDHWALEVDEDNTHLVLDCPFCGHEVLLSNTGLGGLPTEAECDHCDTVYDYMFDEIFEAELDDEIAKQLMAA